MSNILDQLTTQQTDYSALTENAGCLDEYIPGEFNFAWVVPVVMNGPAGDDVWGCIEQMRCIIDAMSPDGRSKVVDNWMIPQMGYINISMTKQKDADYHEFFVMFNYPESLWRKKWMSMIFWTAAQMARVCCRLKDVNALLVSYDSTERWRRVATLSYNPHLQDIFILVKTSQTGNTLYVREALQECMNGVVTFQELMQFINRIKHRQWRHDRRPIAINVKVNDEMLRNPEYYLADDRSYG